MMYNALLLLVSRLFFFLNITDGSEQGVDDLTLLDLAHTLYAAKKSLLATVQDREDSHADYLKSDSYFP